MTDRYSECPDPGDWSKLDCSQWALNLNLPWVQYLDVGQGDGTFLYFPKGTAKDSESYTMLIDLGSKKNADVAGSCARQFLYCALRAIQAKYGYATPILDYLVLTHGDGDHHNQVLPLMANFAEAGHPLTISRVYIGGTIWDYAEELRQGLLVPQKRAGTLRTLADGASDESDDPQWTFMDGKAKVFVLSANYPQAAGGPKNPKSIVQMLQYAGSSRTLRCIFMGDAEESVETYILKNKKYKDDLTFLKALALKLGHHGSRNGSSEAWIEAVHPQAVFASADMKWAHPYCETLQRVAENTTLWEQPPVHGYLCGEGARDKKYYELHVDTKVGIFANLVKLQSYSTAPPSTPKKGGSPKKKPPPKPRTVFADDMQTVSGTRYQLLIQPSGGVEVSSGALRPGAAMRVLVRDEPGRPTEFPENELVQP